MNAAAPAPEDRDDELEARRDGRLHARAPFVTDAELAYLEQLDDVERSTTLAEGVRRYWLRTRVRRGRHMREMER